MRRAPTSEGLESRSSQRGMRELLGADIQVWMARLDRELENFRVVVRRATSGNDSCVAGPLCRSPARPGASGRSRTQHLSRPPQALPCL